MRITEVAASKPTIFVDMDGVLADLFNHVADIHDVDHYNQMSNEQWDEFANLPPFSTANALLAMVRKMAGGYKILSSPLNFDKEGSIRGKRAWLSKHISVPADGYVFEHDKQIYAKGFEGQPNILIDDWGTNIKKWRAAGGIGIKYQADENSLTELKAALTKALEQ
jgi:5'(3')-deoxyribonucleotidase